jgi:hypothetical protein
MITTAEGRNAADLTGDALFTDITLTYPNNYAILGSLTLTLTSAGAGNAQFFIEYSPTGGAPWTTVKKFFLVAPGILVIENLGGTMIVPASTDTLYTRTVRGRFIKSIAIDVLDVSMDYNLVVA